MISVPSTNKAWYESTPLPAHSSAENRPEANLFPELFKDLCGIFHFVMC